MPAQSLKKPTHVATKRQITAFINPVRADIYQRLAAFGPLSVKQIALDINLPVTSLYHHLQYLMRVGLIHEIGPVSTRANGRPAALYDAVARVVLLSKEIEKPGHAKLLGKVVRAAAATASRDLGSAMVKLDGVYDGKEKNAGFFRTILSPSPAKLARINTLLNELREITSSPDGTEDGNLMTLAWFMAPALRGKKAKRKK